MIQLTHVDPPVFGHLAWHRMVSHAWVENAKSFFEDVLKSMFRNEAPALKMDPKSSSYTWRRIGVERCNFHRDGRACAKFEATTWMNDDERLPQETQ